MKERKPVPMKIIGKVKLKKYVKTGVEFVRPVLLDTFPDQPFVKAIFYARENLEKSVKWIDGIPWEIDGYPTAVNLGKCNLCLIDWALWNVPIFLVSHAPGKDYAVFDLEVDGEEVDEEVIEIKKQIIHDLRKVKQPLVEKIDELLRKEEQWREAYTEIKDKAEVERGFNLQKRWEDMQDKKISRKIGLWDVLLVVLLIVFFVIIIIWIVSFGQISGEVLPKYNETISIINRWFN